MKSQMKKLISIFACVCLLLTAIVIPASAAETSATISFADKAYRTSYSTSQQVWEQNGIKVINNKGKSTSSVGDYANPGRFYKSSETIVEYPGMTKLVIDATGIEAKYRVWNTSFTDSNATASVDGSITTITFATAVDSFTFSSMAAQCRANSMTAYATVADDTTGDGDDTTGDDTTGDDTTGDDTTGDDTTDDDTTATSSETFVFADYVVSGELGGGAPSRELGDNITFTISSGWISSDTARIYQNANAIISSKVDISSIVINAGYKTSTFDVYTSTDGETWTMYQEDVPYVEGYSDVTITFENPVKYIKIDAPNKQVRMKTMTVTFVGSTTGGETPEEPEEPETPVVPEEPETPDVPAADSTLTIEAAAALGAGMTHNTTTEGKYYVSGVIKNVANATYGNMTIQDDAGNTLYIYGTYSADGAKRYDAMEVKPVAGDTVKLYGVIGNYNGAQMKNAWIVEHTPATTPEEPDVPEEPETPDVPAADSTLTIEAAAALGAGMTHNTTTEGKYYVSGVIKSVANTIYGNMTIQDDAGNTLYIYGTYSADGTNRYDAMEVKPVAGDTVKLYGVIGNYNGAQMKNGWIVEHTPATTPEEPEEPDTPVVPDEPETPAESATITFDADKANRTEYDNNHQIWAQNGITVTNNKAASTTNVGNYGNPGRFYMGSEVIIEYPGMTKIVIDSVTYNDNDYAGAWVDSFDTTLGTATVTDGDVTIVLNSAVDSLKFAKMAAQGRAYTITVYTTVEGGETPEEPDTPVVPDEPDTPVTPESNTLTIVEAIALGASKEHNTYTTDKYYVTGEITEVYNTQYGNMKIKDADGNILTIYGTYDADGTNRYDAMEVKPVAGDTVKVYGIIGQYNGTPQMKNGWIVEHTPATTPEEPETPDTPETPDPEADSELTIVEAIALGASKAHNTYTEGKYYITAEITEVYGPQYGNMRVTDADGNILTIYGSWSADGTVRYDALEEKPIAGDTVKLYGIIGQYNDTPQMKNAWIIEIVEKGEGQAPVAPETAEEILADAAELNPGETLPYAATLTGTVVSIDNEYSEEYGNITVTIEVKDTDGKTIQCYRMKGEGAETLAVGDDITVTGFITNYNGTVQFNTGATFVPAGDDTTGDDTTGDDTTGDDTTGDDTTGDNTTEDKPVEDKPVEDKPVEDKPVEDKPVEDKPVEDKPAEDKPADDNTAADDTVADDDTAADDTVADDDASTDDTTSPETGDSVAAVATMALAAAAVILYTRKRR